MKTYRGPDGGEKLWFEEGEIDEIAEGELRKAGLLPDAANPAVDVERFVEKHLHARLDLNANLPESVLGCTEFERGGTVRVSVNGDLTSSMEELESPGLLGRWRATLAHEAAHVLLHRHLFYLDERQGELFRRGSETPKLLRCLNRQVRFSAGAHDWREVQANKGMASTLMPRRLFTEVALREKRLRTTSDEPLPAESQEAADLTVQLSGLFAVSFTAASIRLATCGLTMASVAQTLPSR